jgi:hypothetical protein
MGLMQRKKTADILDAKSRGPSYVTLYWPNPMINSRVTHIYPERSWDIVSENLEHDSANGKRNNERPSAFGHPLFNLLNKFRRNVYFMNSFVARCYEQLAPSVIYERSSVGHPDNVSRRGLLQGVKATVFRVWNNSLVWVKVLKHESGFHGPGRK